VSENRPVTVRWLTAAAWLTVLTYATVSALKSVSLETIGRDLNIGFGPRGGLAAAESVVIAVVTFLVGVLADRIGKRRLFVVASGVVALGLLRIGWSRGYVGLVGAVAVAGIGMGAWEALLSPLTADLHADRVEMHMNLMHAFYPTGLVLSSCLIGLALDRGVPWRVLFTVAAVPASVLALMFLSGRYPSRPPQAPLEPLRVGTIVRDGRFWLLAAVMTLTAGTEGSLIVWAPNFVQVEYGASALAGGAGLTVFAGAMALGRFGTGLAAARVPLPKIMGVMLALGIGSTSALVLGVGLWATYAALAVCGLVVACFWPSVLALATRRIGAGSATLLAMLSVAGIVGFGALPWTVGCVAEGYGLRMGLALLPGALVLAGVAFAAVARSPGAPSAGRGTAGGP